MKTVYRKENRNCSFSRARCILRIGILIFLLKFYLYLTDSALFVRGIEGAGIGGAGIEGAGICSAVCDSSFKYTPRVCIWQIVVVVVVVIVTFIIVIMTVIITHRVSCP